MSTSIRWTWWAPTSQVTGKPSFLAARTSSMPAADEMRHRCTRAPVARISSKIVCRAMVSAITGTPDKPRRDATGPLCAMPPRARCGILRPQPDRVAEGLRILQRAQQHGGVDDRLLGLRKADAAGLGQLRHLGQRLPFQADRQARRADTHAPGSASAARCLSISTRPGSSSTGSVSGGQTRLVTPPCIAARISDSSVALYS